MTMPGKNRLYLHVVMSVLLSVIEIGAQSSSRYYQKDAPWFQNVASSPKDPHSDKIIQWLQSQGGWGLGRMQIDFSIKVLDADAATPLKHFTPNDDFYEGECDLVPVPLPPNGSLEGESGYRCSSDGDCHLLVFNKSNRKLYEMWRANIENQIFYGGCLVVWDLNLSYKPEGRGEGCTSSDAAGLPIAPLLFDADEVASGTINHAIRFILPNSLIRHRTYVRPATHATSAAQGAEFAPPYGTRLRLRANYPLESLPNNASRVVAKAMQNYGIILADGGNIALTARNDINTNAKWSTLLAPQDLKLLKVTDFEMVEAGTRFTWNGKCSLIPQTAVKKNLTVNNFASNIRWKIKDGVLSIVSGDREADGRVAVYSPDGKIVCVQKFNVNVKKIRLRLRGMYIVEIESNGRSHLFSMVYR